MKQTTNTILMIEPISFGFNQQTAANNYFQQKDGLGISDIQGSALAEFNLMLEQLRSKGLNIIAVKDTPEPHTPDSIFPNNWVSFHEDGRVVLYTMYAENRRAERRKQVGGLPGVPSLGWTFGKRWRRFRVGYAALGWRVARFD